MCKDFARKSWEGHARANTLASDSSLASTLARVGRASCERLLSLVEPRSTARQRKVCREALRAPRCTCSADQAERVDEMSRRSAVRLAAVHHFCDRRSMASPLSEAGTLQALAGLWRCPADPAPPRGGPAPRLPSLLWTGSESRKSKHIIPCAATPSLQLLGSIPKMWSDQGKVK